MKVEIWSDIMCPFCYLGKHRFEKALAQFEHKDKIEIEWRSFQLDPTLTGITSIEDYFAKKGMPTLQMQSIQENMQKMAQAEGIEINIEKTIISNTYKAHQLIQLAKSLNLQNQIEEILFEMYFKEGYNMDEVATVYEAAKRAGIDTEVVKSALENDTYKSAFEEDIQLSRQFGISGVPFFIFDRKYAVSGAQTPEHFFGALTQSFNEWQQAQPTTIVDLSATQGDSCDINGNCN